MLLCQTDIHKNTWKCYSGSSHSNRCVQDTHTHTQTDTFLKTISLPAFQHNTGNLQDTLLNFKVSRYFTCHYTMRVTLKKSGFLVILCFTNITHIPYISFIYIYTWTSIHPGNNSLHFLIDIKVIVNHSNKMVMIITVFQSGETHVFFSEHEDVFPRVQIRMRVFGSLTLSWWSNISGGEEIGKPQMQSRGLKWIWRKEDPWDLMTGE